MMPTSTPFFFALAITSLVPSISATNLYTQLVYYNNVNCTGDIDYTYVYKVETCEITFGETYCFDNDVGSLQVSCVDYVSSTYGLFTYNDSSCSTFFQGYIPGSACEISQDESTKYTCEEEFIKAEVCSDLSCGDCTSDESSYFPLSCTKDSSNETYVKAFCTPEIPTQAPTTLSPEFTTLKPILQPTQPPTLSPEIKTISDDECFSGDDSVFLESGLSKSFSELEVGDKIYTVDANGNFSFSSVIALPHAKNSKLTSFVDVVTTSGKSVKATKMHLLQQCDGSLIYAAKITVGQCLRTVDGDESVTSVSMSLAQGIYTAVTTNEFIVVNGIIASPFAVTHYLAHKFYKIHRAVADFFPSALESNSVLTVNTFIGAVFLSAGSSK